MDEFDDKKMMNPRKKKWSLIPRDTLCLVDEPIYSQYVGII